MKKIIISGLVAFGLFAFILPNVQASSVQGWKNVNGSWYYYNSSHTTLKGWLFDRSHWYYLGSDGKMKRGWLQQDGKWYYLNEITGAMRTGWQQYKSQWYYFNRSGVMQTGWVKDHSKWYYMDSNGKMQTGHVKIENNWYYFNIYQGKNEGVMQTGWFSSSRTGPGDAGYYYAYANGKIAVDTLVDGYYVDSYGLYLQAPALEETVKQLEPVARTYGATMDVDYYFSGPTQVENMDIKLLINGEVVTTTNLHFREKPTSIGGDRVNKDILIDSAIAMGCPLEKEKLTELVNQVSDGSLSEGIVSVHNLTGNYIAITW
ncbi:MAG: hypothetical protein ABGX20_14470 [Bacillus sp. (in: firmicutes)]